MIRNFLSAKSHVADSTLKLAVLTFKTLAAEAFERSPAPPEPLNEEARTGAVREMPAPAPPPLSIAIQVYIDKDMSAETVDQVFASMARHLYGRE
ncbi:MAG: hypothetical protein ACRDGH_02295 [Candidatus Limnocylindria bacterium]